MIDELVLNEEQAEAIVEKAIEFQVYTDGMPDTKKGKLEAAHEIVAFTIDSWQQENPNPETDAGKDMLAMFRLAGIKVTTGGEIEYTNVAAANGDKSDAPVTPTPFDIDSYIEGYSELTAATKIKKIKAKELDPNDDDDYNMLVAIAEWEESQDPPSSRVLDYLNEIIPPAEEEGIDHQADVPAAVEPEPDPEPEADTTAEPWTEETLSALARDELKALAEQLDVEFPQRLTGPGKRRVVNLILKTQEPAPAVLDPDGLDEPWEGYNEASDDDIIAVINNIDEYVEGDPIEALEYVLRYERSMDEPSPVLVELLEVLIPPVEEDQPEYTAEEPVAKVDTPEKPPGGSSLGHLTDAAIKSSEHSAALRKAGLGAPPDFEGDMPELPADIDAVDHSQLSNLMHAFQNALSTAAWQASMAYIEADMFEEIADYLENRALLSSEQTNDTKRKAEARTDEEYLLYRGHYKARYHDYVRFRDLAKTLEGKVKVLSRTGGFKEEEQEAGDRSATPRLRRRAA